VAVPWRVECWRTLWTLRQLQALQRVLVRWRGRARSTAARQLDHGLAFARPTRGGVLRIRIDRVAKPHGLISKK
jgi:hypothetical protein